MQRKGGALARRRARFARRVLPSGFLQMSAQERQVDRSGWK
jgi:hypothetical protein